MRAVSQKLQRREPNGIYLIDIDAPDISSSRIRELVTAGKRIHHLVPGPVHEYIRKLNLYGEQ
ncbi:MAG: hypothetical protein MZV64_34475 [Ignavibacteriales bacterium]|nr:hypothetical protein [Ignavibacteriales bacterium]